MPEMKFRHETKRFIIYAKYLVITNRLKTIDKLDRNVDKDGRYLILRGGDYLTYEERQPFMCGILHKASWRHAKTQSYNNL